MCACVRVHVNIRERERERVSIITDCIGSFIALTNVFEALVDDRIVSVLPYLNQRMPPLSYVAADLP